MSAQESLGELEPLDTESMHTLQLAGWIGAMPFHEAAPDGPLIRRVLSYDELIKIAIDAGNNETNLPTAS